MVWMNKQKKNEQQTKINQQIMKQKTVNKDEQSAIKLA